MKKYKNIFSVFCSFCFSSNLNKLPLEASMPSNLISFSASPWSSACLHFQLRRAVFESAVSVRRSDRRWAPNQRRSSNYLSIGAEVVLPRRSVIHLRRGCEGGGSSDWLMPQNALLMWRGTALGEERFQSREPGQHVLQQKPVRDGGWDSDGRSLN